MDTLTKQPNEAILFDMSFAGLGSMSRGDNIANVISVVTDINTLTISDITHDNKKTVQFRASSGLDGINYKVTVLVSTLAGDTLEGEGVLKVVDL